MQHAAHPQGGRGSGGPTPPPSSIRLPEISTDLIGELMVIAQRIGGDFKMSVSIGNPGEGSFFDPASCSITLDPVHVVQSPLLAKFVAGHEGSHRAITFSLTQLGMSEEESTFYLSQIGYQAGFNGCEDTAVNSWMVKVFPGMENATKAIYNEMFCRPNVEVKLPAIEVAKEKLGRYPLFGHYIGETLRFWHTGSFGPNLDPEVARSLRRTQSALLRYTAEVPAENAPVKERLESMARRMEIYRHEIWPEVQRLVAFDLKNEAETELLRQMLLKREELKRLQEHRKGIRHDSSPHRDGNIDKRIQQLEGELRELQKQAGGALAELNDALDELIRKAAEHASELLEKAQARIDDATKNYEQVQRALAKLEQQLARTSDQEKRAALEQEIRDKREELERAERELQEANEAFRQLQRQLSGQGGRGGGAGIDLSKLSPGTQKALRELFQKLPAQIQQRLQDQAEQNLKAFDDGVSDELAGKLNDRDPNHAEREQAKQAPEYSHAKHLQRYFEQQLEHFEVPREEIQEHLRRNVKPTTSPWTKALSVVGDQVNPLYVRLKRFFRPQADPAWEPDYSSGGRLNLDRVMQSEADPRMLDRLWERRGVPRVFDYRFSFLVDISGSMQGPKAEETFKGLVVLAEVLERLQIPYEISCFGSFFSCLKPFKERLTDLNRHLTALSLLSNGGGTLDAFAVQCSYKRLLANLGKDNFLIVMTDGESGMRDLLASTVAKIRSEKQVRLLALGLGAGTDFVKESYPRGIPNIEMRLSQKARDAGGYEFLDVITIVIEDMLKNPEAYQE